MSIACQKQYSLTVSPAISGDLTMDQAIYHAATNKIFGVRGQWLFRLNATTAAFEAALRFAPNGIGRSCITSVGPSLYIGLMATTDPNPNAIFPAPTFPQRDVWFVNAAAFTVTGRLGLDTKLVFSFTEGTNSQDYGDGNVNLVTDGVGLFGENDDEGRWSLDTAFNAGYHRQSTRVAGDSVFDADHGVVWYAIGADPNIWARDADLTSFNQAFNAGPSCGAVSGITYCHDFNLVYCVRNTSDLLRVDVSTVFPGYNNFGFTTLNTGRVNANPFRLKYVPYGAGHPFTHKILIPNFNDDTVTVWNPATDTAIATKTGFTSPFDIVNTPSKSFALQSDVTGIKEIV